MIALTREKEMVMIVFWVFALLYLLQIIVGALQRDQLIFLNGVSNYSRHFGQLIHEGLITAPKPLPVSWHAPIRQAMTLILAIICVSLFKDMW
jgi:hypothetical protein